MRTFIEKGVYVAEFMAGELKTEKQFIDKFWEAFNIANEKVYNLNVLNDYMRDLFWIEPKSFMIIIKDYHIGINKGYNLGVIIESLNFYKEFWNKKGHRFDIIIL